MIGRVEVLEHSSASGFDVRRDLGEHLVLEARVLEDRLDDQVAAGEVGRRRRSAVIRASSSAAFSCVMLAALDGLGEELLGVAPCPSRPPRLRDVLEHDLHAGAGARVGDAGAHHPGAEDADLGGLQTGSMPSGRSAPALIACRSKKNAWIMFFEFLPVTSSAR